LLALL
jgi:hypothetical protein